MGMVEHKEWRTRAGSGVIDQCLGVNVEVVVDKMHGRSHNLVEFLDKGLRVY